eukprot:516389-Prorocentrum_minimum.AAC.1
MQNQGEQDIKVLTSLLHAEMPNEVYAKFVENLQECLQKTREMFQATSLPGEFGVMGKAKGSRSR